MEGSIGPVTMYKLYGKWVMRQRYGPDAKTMTENENYTPQRNHGKEFGGVSRASKLLREGFRRLISEMADPEMHGRMTKTLNAIKNLDISPKGERTVARGLLKPGGRAMLTGWNANLHGMVPIGAIKKATQALESETLVLLHTDVTASGKAVKVTAVWMRVDFEHGDSRSEEMPAAILLPGGEVRWQRPVWFESASGTVFLIISIRELIPNGKGWTASGDRRKMGLVVI